jgi:hypothetical protein
VVVVVVVVVVVLVVLGGHPADAQLVSPKLGRSSPRVSGQPRCRRRTPERNTPIADVGPKKGRDGFEGKLTSARAHSGFR